ncbi:hypothetical protein MMC29_001688 [Sticta canariensis]|nr:hypothetical protein [Sticta canariensis]
MDPKPSALDPPGMTSADEDYHIERSPSKRRMAVYEPERTPGGTAPNSARKRRSGHTLSRATPTPSHGVKMSGIFQDAAVSLKACFASPTTSSPNMKKLRTPVRQAQMGPFGCTRGQDHLVFPQATLTPKPGSTPASSLPTALTPPAIPYGPDFPTPLLAQRFFCECQNKLDSSGDEAKESGGRNRARQIIADHCINTRTDNVTYPKLNPWRMPGFSSVPSSLSSECHSTHGVPLVIPIPTTSHEKAEVIDSWLSEVYEPETPLFSSDDSYTPQSPDRNLYAPQSPEHKPYAPQSPDHQSSGPQSPSADLEQQQGSISKQSSTFQRSPKRPFTPLHSLPNPLVVRAKIAKTEMPMSASSSNTANPLPVYPILPSTGANHPASADCRSTPSPSPTHSLVSPQNLRSFPMYEPLRPSAESGPPTPHPSPISYPKRKRTGIRSPLDIPIYAPTVRPLTRQITSPNEKADLPVKELSPHVERYRKGYGPQPGRRPSYWDRDILGARANGEGDGNKEATLDENDEKNRSRDSLGDAQKAMGESERSEELIKAKPATGGTENAKSGLCPQKG